MSSTPTLLPSSATPQGAPSFDLDTSHFDPSPSSSSRPSPKRSFCQLVGSPGSGIWKDIKGVSVQLDRTGRSLKQRKEGAARADPRPSSLDSLLQRAPFYVSDWTDAWNYRVLPATAFVFFSNVLVSLRSEEREQRRKEEEEELARLIFRRFLFLDVSSRGSPSRLTSSRRRGNTE